MDRATIKTQFQENYGIANLQFDERGNPIFFFEDNLTIINTIAPDFAPVFTDKKIDDNVGLVTVNCGSSQIKKKFFGACYLGTPLGNGKRVEDFDKASQVACSRALHRYFNAINFNPLKAHFNAQNNVPFAPVFETIESESHRLIKAIHALRDELDLDEITYRNHLVTATTKEGIPGQASAANMDVEDLILVQTFLQGIKAGIAAAQRKITA